MKIDDDNWINRTAITDPWEVVLVMLCAAYLAFYFADWLGSKFGPFIYFLFN